MTSISAVRSERRSEHAADATGLIKGLGWFGLGLGVGELAFPRALARVAGLECESRAPSILRTMGLREIASGLAILFRPEHPAPRWARVVGDVLDLGLLGFALTQPTAGRRRLIPTLGAIAGITALDALATRRTAQPRKFSPVIAAVTINKPPMQVYEFFRKLEQLPQFMDYLVSVEPRGDRRSTWTARLPIGGRVSWETEIVEDRPGDVLSWRSVAGSRIKTRGRVTFTRAPGRDMTEVRVELQLGALGRGPMTSLARRFARPQIKADLQRLKQVLETGEVLYSDASVHRLPHAAQPSSLGAHETAPGMFAGSRSTTVKEVTP